MEDSAIQMLLSAGWVNVATACIKLPEEDIIELTRLLCNEIETSEIRALQFIVRPEFSARVLAQQLEPITLRAETDASQKQNNSEGIRRSEVAKDIQNSHEIPQSLANSFAGSLSETLRKRYRVEYRSKLKVFENDERVGKLREELCQQLLHLNCMDEVDDVKLQQKLGEELIEPLRGLGERIRAEVSKSREEFATMEQLLCSSKTDKLEVVQLKRMTSIFADLVGHPTVVDLENRQGILLERISKQLAMAIHPALVLHLTVVLRFAAAAKGHCVLQCTGKLVPKILKEIKSRVSSTEYVLLQKLKEAVVSRNEQTDEVLEIVQCLKSNPINNVRSRRK